MTALGAMVDALPEERGRKNRKNKNKNELKTKNKKKKEPIFAL